MTSSAGLSRWCASATSQESTSEEGRGKGRERGKDEEKEKGIKGRDRLVALRSLSMQIPSEDMNTKS